MRKVVGVGFKDVGKIYYFNPDPFKLHIGSMVVVETARGLELGKVMTDEINLEDPKIESDLKDIVRPASERDIKNFIYNEQRAVEITPIIKDIIKKCKLEMKYVGCEYTLDASKVLIYYTADGRVDFRELVKELASELKTRIELRQIGPREATKLMGGLGECGREVCCAKHLRECGQVTMKMAKDQNMSLASNKITGVCGKLLCCISYEAEVYADAKKRLPGVGDIVDTPDLKNKVVTSIDCLKETVSVKGNDDNVVTYKASDVKIIKKRHSNKEDENDEEDS